MISEHAQVDYLMLVQSAEAINGKIYIIGGGWNQLTVQVYGQMAPVAIAMSVSVPWNRSNMRIPLKIAVLDSDGHELIPPATTNLVAGRTPDMYYGQRIPSPMALTLLPAFPQKGVYSVVATITDDGVEYETVTSFYVRAQGEEIV